jgi:PKD domain
MRESLRRFACALVVGAVAMGFVGCGGGKGGEPTAAQSISGRVIDGYLVGAQVFWDCNDNFVIDETTEPWVGSEAGGRYTIASAPSNDCVLRAIVPQWTIDETTGLPVGQIYRLSALRDAPDLITPFTTLLTDGNYTLQEIQALTGFSGDVRSDYIARGATGIADANIAGVIAIGLSTIDSAVLAAQADGRQVPYRSALALLPPSAFNVSATQYNTPAFVQQVVDSAPMWEQAMSTVRLPEHRFVLDDEQRSRLCLDFETQVPVSQAECERRKTFVRGAIALAERYRASSGRSIYWSAIPRSERVLLGGSDVIPTNAQIAALREQLQAEIVKKNADLEVLRKKMNTEELLRLTSSTADLALRGLDTGKALFEAVHPGARIVGSAYKPLVGYKRLKTSIRHLADVGSAKNLRKLAVTPECAATLAYDGLDAIANTPDNGLTVDSAVVGALGDVMSCLFQVVGNERFKAIISAGATGATAAFDSADFLSRPATQVDVLKEVLALIDVATAGTDLAQLKVVSGALKAVAYMVDANYQNLSLKKNGDEALAGYLTALENSLRTLSPVFEQYGGLIFAARINPYIVLDVHRDFTVTDGLATTFRVDRLAAIASATRSALQPKQGLVFTPGQATAGVGGVISYEWDFGDGTVKELRTSPELVTHAYALPGTYTATLRTQSHGPASLSGEPGETYEGVVSQAVVVVASAGDGLSTDLSDDFTASTLDTSKWSVRSADLRGQLPTYSLTDGALQVDVPGGSDGYMGIASGIVFTPNRTNIAGDFEVSVQVRELLRTSRDGYKDNSGVMLDFGAARIGLAGNYSGYWDGYPYGVYNNHRVQAFDSKGAVCAVDESLLLSSLYAVELRIRRLQGVSTMGYRLDATQPWKDWNCTLPQSAQLSITFWSGDGGFTRSTGRFVGAMDNFTLRLPPSPVTASPSRLQ